MYWQGQLDAEIRLNLVRCLLGRFENLLGKLIVAVIRRNRNAVRLDRFPVEPGIEPGDFGWLGLCLSPVLAGEPPVIADLNSRRQVVGLQIERIGDLSRCTRSR